MSNIAEFIADAGQYVHKHSPGLYEIFEMYANEARFGYSIIEADLAAVPSGAAILEIGAGILLLSAFLSSTGFQVTALEPISKDFSHFQKIQQLLRLFYEERGVELNLVENAIEDLSLREKFDYAFSINVFEHIHDIETGFVNAYLSLKSGGGLRVYCPNYSFPYEPHFNLPTLVGKRLTEICLGHWILGSQRVPKPKETWDALNWINVTRTRRIIAKHFGVSPCFNKNATYQIIIRIFSDPQFRSRKSQWVFLILETIHRMGLSSLFKIIPVCIAPIMDLKIERANYSVGKV